MYIKTVIILAVICEVFGYHAKCDKECLAIPKHLEELDCLPVSENGDCCPIRYECPDFKNFDKEKCAYKTTLFNPGEILDPSTTEPACSTGCHCESNRGFAPRLPKFECAHIECPDLFRPLNPDCIAQYDLNSCCSTKTVCEKSEIENLSKCEFEGRIYREGQRMYPKNRCYTCICSQNFKNEPIEENLNCRKIDCGISWRYMTEVREGCVPIYFGVDRCCPIEWRCPEDNDEIENETGIETFEKCGFGKLKLNFGDVVKSYDRCTTCKCTHPPMMHCIKDAECYTSPRI